MKTQISPPKLPRKPRLKLSPAKARKKIHEIQFTARELIDAIHGTSEVIRSGRVGSLRNVAVDLPAQAPELQPRQIKVIREKMGASQAVFARLLNVPKGTAIAWEKGVRRPSGAALKLLHIAKKKPEVLVEVG